MAYVGYRYLRCWGAVRRRGSCPRLPYVLCARRDAPQRSRSLPGGKNASTRRGSCRNPTTETALFLASVSVFAPLLSSHACACRGPQVHSLDSEEGDALQRLIRAVNCNFLALSATIGNAQQVRAASFVAAIWNSVKAGCFSGGAPAPVDATEA